MKSREILKKISRVFRKDWQIIIVIILAFLFFLGTSSFNYYTQKDGFIKWASPDETANYNIAKLYGQEGKMSIFESFNAKVDEIMHPRSFRSDNGYIKPVSFLGIIIIFGKIVSLFGYKVLPYLTPFFGALGIIFYYLLIKRLFGRQNAFISVFFLATFPVFIYYSCRSMFHNVLFTSLLIIGFYFAVLSGQKNSKKKSKFLTYAIKDLDWRKFLYPAIAGVSFGLAIITRASELMWLGPILVIIYLVNINKLGIVKPIVLLAFLFAAILPSLYWNQVLYGSPISSGYPEMNQSITNITSSSADLVKVTLTGASQKDSLAKKVFDNIFHFGFHPQKSFKIFLYYFVYMFPWIFVPAGLGLIIFLQKWSRWKKKDLAYIISFIVLSLILVFYYGSWEFYDNPDPKSFTIGNSYTRYWLPMYLGAIPLASLFWLRFTRALYPFNLPSLQNSLNKTLKKLKKFNIKLFSTSLQIILVAIILYGALDFVLFGSDEGLYYLYQRQVLAKNEFDKVMELTENNSVIITRYHDKLFFPERKVIVGLFDDANMNARYSHLVDLLPVYYYNFNLPDKDFEYLNNSRLKTEKMQIEKISRVTKDFTLYKIERYIENPEKESAVRDQK